MWKWLLPHDTSFFTLFEQHSALVVEGAQELLRLTSENQPWVERSKKIKEIEHQADKITHQCIEELHKTFITPFQRDDIHRLISTMDDVIDLTHDIAARLVIYKIQSMRPETQGFVEILVRATTLLQKIVTGLKSVNLDHLKPLFIEIHELENEADTVYLMAIGKLFEEYEDTRLILKWKEIYEYLETAIDRCEDVANIIEGVMLESH